MSRAQSRASLTRIPGLRPGPRFQVLRPIVVADAVSVVNPLVWEKEASEQFLRDEDVLKDVRT